MHKHWNKTFKNEKNYVWKFEKENPEINQHLEVYHFLPNRGAMKKLGGHINFSWEIGGSQKIKRFLDGYKF